MRKEDPMVDDVKKARGGGQRVFLDLENPNHDPRLMRKLREAVNSVADEQDRRAGLIPKQEGRN